MRKLLLWFGVSSSLFFTSHVSGLSGLCEWTFTCKNSNNWNTSCCCFLTLAWEMVRLSTGWAVSNSWISSITWASEPRITTLCSQPSAAAQRGRRRRRFELTLLLSYSHGSFQSSLLWCTFVATQNTQHTFDSKAGNLNMNHTILANIYKNKPAPALQFICTIAICYSKLPHAPVTA